MRRRDVFGPAAFDFALQWLGDNTPHGGLHLCGAIAAVEPRLAEHGVLRPHYLLLPLLRLVLPAVRRVCLWGEIILL